MRCIFAILTLLAATATLRAEHRVALLIANSDYGEHKLSSPANDVKAVESIVSELGYQTVVAENLNRDKLKSTIDQFINSVPTRGTALVYFAGYALQGQNNGQRDSFLIPVGEQIRSDRDTGGKGYGVTRLLERLQNESGSSTNLIFVDGCYGWPTELQNVPQGLAGVSEVGRGSLVWHGARPGEVVDAGRKLSPLAEDFENVIREIRGQGKPGTLQKYYTASSLSTGDCMDAKLASIAISPPDKLIEGNSAGDEWVSAQGTVFCWCPPGKFTMGSAEDLQQPNDDENAVEVTLTQGFWMAKYETTKRESTRSPRNSVASDKNHPIDYVHYDDFKAHLRTLNSNESKAGRLPENWEYDLPTEAQWEYACRAGTSTAYSFGDDAAQLAEHCNFADQALYDARDDYHRYAHHQWNDAAAYLAVVGSYQPNAWGLCDMHGNMWEVCSTRYASANVGGIDPLGDPKNGAWAARGGSWASLPNYCRSAFRHRFASRDEQHWLGYRIVLRKK